jgi:hypothetical protein
MLVVTVLFQVEEWKRWGNVVDWGVSMEERANGRAATGLTNLQRAKAILTRSILT